MPQSPRRLKKQIRDAVGEQVRDLPITAVRLAMFGVGRALLLSDRVTKDVKEMRESGVLPVLDHLREDVQHAAGKVVGRVIERVSGAEPEAEIPVARPRPAAAAADSTVRPARRVNSSLAASPEITVGKPAPNGQSVRPGTAPRRAPGTAGTPAAKPAPVPKPAPAPEAAPAPKPAEPAKPGPSTAKAPAAGAAQKTPERAPEKATVKAPAKPAEPKAAAAKTAPAEAAPGKPATKQAKPAEKAAPKTAAAKPAAPKTAAPKTAAPKTAAPSAASLPVPNYDEASVPALRARLRGLSADQVQKLREYERANAARPEVLRMYDNRISKLREQA